jgi:hypothetical protein
MSAADRDDALKISVSSVQNHARLMTLSIWGIKMRSKTASCSSAQAGSPSLKPSALSRVA